MIRLKITSILLLCTLFLSGCNFKKSKSEIEVEFTQDTLAIGYTYWWSEATPFHGYCGDAHSLVFTGVISDIKDPSNDSGPLYTSQEGVIEIERLYKVKDIGENIYAEQKYMSTDCFFESDLKKGDTVLVFCYDYENDYVIPGKECILKIDDFDDPLIKSIRKYIDADDNPLALKKDIDLWTSVGLGKRLEAIIECAQEMKDMNTQ